MSAEMTQIKLEYEPISGIKIEQYFEADQETMKKANIWLKADHKNVPTPETFAEWLESNGGQHHREDGPAYVKKGKKYSEEKWYEHGGLRREKIEDHTHQENIYRMASDPCNYSTDKWYDKKGKLCHDERIEPENAWYHWYSSDGELHRDRNEGPAMVMENRLGGFKSEYYYEHGKRVSAPTLPNLSAIPGVSITP